MYTINILKLIDKVNFNPIKIYTKNNLSNNFKIRHLLKLNVKFKTIDFSRLKII